VRAVAVPRLTLSSCMFALPLRGRRAGRPLSAGFLPAVEFASRPVSFSSKFVRPAAAPPAACNGRPPRPPNRPRDAPETTPPNLPPSPRTPAPQPPHPLPLRRKGRAALFPPPPACQAPAPPAARKITPAPPEPPPRRGRNRPPTSPRAPSPPPRSPPAAQPGQVPPPPLRRKGGRAGIFHRPQACQAEVNKRLTRRSTARTDRSHPRRHRDPFAAMPSRRPDSRGARPEPQTACPAARPSPLPLAEEGVAPASSTIRKPVKRSPRAPRAPAPQPARPAARPGAPSPLAEEGGRAGIFHRPQLCQAEVKKRLTAARPLGPTGATLGVTRFALRSNAIASTGQPRARPEPPHCLPRSPSKPPPPLRRKGRSRRHLPPSATLSSGGKETVNAPLDRSDRPEPRSGCPLCLAGGAG
jgi:hypothetical protein